MSDDILERLRIADRKGGLGHEAHDAITDAIDYIETLEATMRAICGANQILYGVERENRKPKWIDGPFAAVARIALSKGRHAEEAGR